MASKTKFPKKLFVAWSNFSGGSQSLVCGMSPQDAMDVGDVCFEEPWQIAEYQLVKQKRMVRLDVVVER